MGETGSDFPTTNLRKKKMPHPAFGKNYWLQTCRRQDAYEEGYETMWFTYY